LPGLTAKGNRIPFQILLIFQILKIVLNLANMNIILQTPRLIVREFLSDEEELLVNLYKDERVTKHVAKRSEGDTRLQFKGAVKAYKNGTGMGRWGVFTPGNDFIGVCILKYSDSDPKQIELGYVLDFPYWGLGLATELTKALLVYGFDKKGLKEICACTTTENLASQNVLLKSGFTSHGTVFWHKSDLPFFKIAKPS
jgi:ribosomal-protein-alanine N-acetyltransferase